MLKWIKNFVDAVMWVFYESKDKDVALDLSKKPVGKATNKNIIKE